MSPTRQRQPGFTLLELMVVMVLLGLVASMTLPRLSRWYAGVQARAEAGLVLEGLRAQAFRAGALRRDLRLTARSVELGGEEAGLAHLSLPPGWALRRVVETVFRADGLCGNGLLALSSPSDQALMIVIKGPSCEFSWQPDPSAGAAP